MAVYYSFYTHYDKKQLVYRTVTGCSELMQDLKLFDTIDQARSDFFELLYDNEHYRQGEYVDSNKGKKEVKAKPAKVIVDNSPQPYDKVAHDFKLTVNKVYNLKAEVFMKEIPNSFVDYVITSPPYNVKDRVGGGTMYEKYEDNMTPEEYEEWLYLIIDELLRITKKHVFFNIQMLGKNKETIMRMCGRYATKIKDRMTWVKSIVAPHIQEGVMNSGFEDIYIFSNDRPEQKKFSDARWSQGTFSNTIKGINASQNEYAKLNKATFPLYLPRTILNNFGKKGDLVYDPFNGTGTTAEACIIEGYNYLGTDLDIDQCEITNKRMENANLIQRLW